MLEILLASYNGERFIREQLDSIFQQTSNDWHLTVSDDISTDATPEIINEYIKQYPNRMTRVYPPIHFGNARDHFFWLMSQCQADIMMFADQDDVWYPDKVQTFLKAMEDGKRQYGANTPILVFSDLMPVDEDLNTLAASLSRWQNMNMKDLSYQALTFSNVVTGCACAFNRTLARVAFSEDTKGIIMHDWWLGLCAARFGKIIYLPQTTVKYRQHSSNSVGAKNVCSLKYILKKLSSLPEVRIQAVQRKKIQAAAFESLYSEKMTPEDRRFIRDFVRPHSGLQFYWRYRKHIHGIPRLMGMLLLG